MKLWEMPLYAVSSGQTNTDSGAFSDSEGTVSRKKMKNNAVGVVEGTCEDWVNG